LGYPVKIFIEHKTNITQKQAKGKAREAGSREMSNKIKLSAEQQD